MGGAQQVNPGVECQPGGEIIRLSVADDIRFECDERPLLPDGEYQAVYVHHETHYTFRTPKVYIWFRVVTQGEWFGKMLYRPYRVKSLTGKPRKNGGFHVRRGSDLFMDLARVLEMKARPDRVSASVLAGRVWRVRTRTVTRDYMQRLLPEWMRYSVVETIIGADTS